MTGARMSIPAPSRGTTLATLRDAIGRLETAEMIAHARAALGHEAADHALGGGLSMGALHEVYARAGPEVAVAPGFAAALTQRIVPRRDLIWIRQEAAARMIGELDLHGFAELGCDPRQIIAVRVNDAGDALRAAAEALTCNALGAVVLELWGDTKAVDLRASRKLTLAAQGSGVTPIVVRLAATPHESTAASRWVIGAAPSDVMQKNHRTWRAEVWGAPVFDAELVRNRHGRTGRWIMEWNCDARSFSAPAAHGGLAAIPADRSSRTPAARVPASVARVEPVRWVRRG
jgi:protein ImuA